MLCYDRASNILGKNSVFATKIQKKQAKAFPTRCRCQTSSLSFKDSTKVSKLLSDAMVVTFKEIFH